MEEGRGGREEELRRHVIPRLPTDDEDDEEKNDSEDDLQGAGVQGVDETSAVAAAVAAGDGGVGHNDQQDNESQAASDVAVVGSPEKSNTSNREKLRKRKRKRSYNSDAAPHEGKEGAGSAEEDSPSGNRKRSSRKRGSVPSDTAVAGAVSGLKRGNESVNFTYPNPRNFAQRLMCALQGNLAPDCLGWAGDGEAVALNPKHLKKGTILSSHFQVSNYAAFIRNFNRWGFRRVHHYNVPDGIITYENSLFQRREPHRVKHMRVDSDIQEYYDQHLKPSAVPDSIEFPDIGNQESQRYEDDEPDTDSGLLPHQQQLIDWLNGNGWTSNEGNPNFFPTLPVQVQPATQASPASSMLQDSRSENLASSLVQLFAQNNLLSPPFSTSVSSMSSREALLGRIMVLAQDYLNHASSSSSSPSGNCAIVAIILQILQVITQQIQQPSPEQRFRNNLNGTTSTLQYGSQNIIPVLRPQPEMRLPNHSQQLEIRQDLNSSVVQTLQTLYQNQPSQQQQLEPNRISSTQELLQKFLRTQVDNDSSSNNLSQPEQVVRASASSTGAAPLLFALQQQLEPPPPPPPQPQQAEPEPSQFSDLLRLLLQPQQQQSGNYDKR